MPIKRIVLGSISEVKETGLRRALARFPDKHVEVVLANARTNLPPQPIGMEQTLLGAVRRARYACNADQSTLRTETLYLGIESGLIVLPGIQAVGDPSEPWAMDQAVIYVLPGNPMVIPIITTSVGITVPVGVSHTCINHSCMAGPTVGEVLATGEDPTIKTDPHKKLCGISRVDLLADAVYAALMQTSLNPNRKE